MIISQMRLARCCTKYVQFEYCTVPFFLRQTEPGLYLLVTFHNLSAPFTVECEGAYIEVERENNGFEARWCGNRVTQVPESANACD